MARKAKTAQDTSPPSVTADEAPTAKRGRKLQKRGSIGSEPQMIMQAPADEDALIAAATASPSVKADATEPVRRGRPKKGTASAQGEAKPAKTPKPAKSGRKLPHVQRSAGSSTDDTEAVHSATSSLPDHTEKAASDGSVDVSLTAGSGRDERANSAVQMDGETGAVQFDWSAIERTAAEPGPNQLMAKLLIAARSEGANSRWPF